ncbi:hypothetical protein F5884DRAFT_857878 [Xylogone sp. PMI_703]|nr:hypothetical protein F5884DRAFT_857878 [Xylogone sp. PMI_703]
MSKKPAVPDAWDDDWEAQADKSDAAEAANPRGQVKLSKAERLAQHAELNKKIWESAEEPETFHYLAAHDTVPLKTEFKPALKVLSRKPAANKAPGDEDDDNEGKQAQPTPEELRLKAQREREEKQRRYDEARARILGTPSGSSSPRNTTPPRGSEEGKSGRGRGRGRGRGDRGDRSDSRRQDTRSDSKELFDPNYSPRSGSVTIQKRNDETTRSGRSTPRDEEQVIRSPKGPDASGRSGFGFANRGGKRG